MSTINVLDAGGSVVPIEKPLTPSRAAASASRPVVLSTEDLAALTALATALAAANASLDNIEAVAVDVTTPSPVKIDQTTPGTTDAVTVKTPADVISYVPVLDTAIYASGDVLFATAAISGVTRINDGRALLVSLTAIDKSKQHPAMTLYFYQTNVTSAAVNAANNLSDADAITCLGFVDIAAADWKDLANNSFLCYSGSKAPNLMLEAASGTTTVYVVGVLTAGTPTFALADLMFKLGLIQY